MTPSIRCACLAVVAAMLGACNANPVTEVTNQIFNLGQSLPAEMRDRNLAGWVAFDEDWAGNYQRIASNALYVQGIKSGTPEYGLRVVRMNLAHSEPGMLWMEQGQLIFMTGAVVPDHLPRLHAGDIVEIRQTGTWKTMTNFVSTGEGNIVVRILCAKSSPDYDACLDRAPMIGRFKGKGETHTPYPASVKAYGFTFTPMYDGDGHPLRNFPADGPKQVGIR